VSAPTQPGRYKAKDAWQSPEKAAAYRVSREPSQFARYEREQIFVRDNVADLPANALVVDVPCGTGRFIPFLTGRGFRYIGADFSTAMIKEAQQMPGERPPLGFLNADAERLPFRDASVDCVIIWRLLHHIGDPAIRQGMLREAARVTRNKVLVSFHHPVSFTHWRKVFQREILGRQLGGHAVSHWELRGEGEACGLRMVDVQGFRKYISINWFACFQKVSATRPTAP
jgi:SAM-dependent methyltransferase